MCTHIHAHTTPCMYMQLMNQFLIIWSVVSMVMKQKQKKFFWKDFLWWLLSIAVMPTTHNAVNSSRSHASSEVSVLFITWLPYGIYWLITSLCGKCLVTGEWLSVMWVFHQNFLEVYVWVKLLYTLRAVEYTNRRFWLCVCDWLINKFRLYHLDKLCFHDGVKQYKSHTVCANHLLMQTMYGVYCSR